MKIYSFWSADTTYFTKFKSLKKAQAVGKHNMEAYIECCKEIEEEFEIEKSSFIPDEVEVVSRAWFNHLIKTDNDIMVLDDELYNLVKD